MVVLTTRCLIVNEEKEVLLINAKKHDIFSGYALPGNTIKANDDSIKSALIRAVKETTGIEINDPNYLTFLEFFNKDLFRRDILFLYAATCKKVEVENTISKTKKIKQHFWLGKDKLDTLTEEDIHPSILSVIKDYLDSLE